MPYRCREANWVEVMALLFALPTSTLIAQLTYEAQNDIIRPTAWVRNSRSTCAQSLVSHYPNLFHVLTSRPSRTQYDLPVGLVCRLTRHQRALSRVVRSKQPVSNRKRL